MYRMSLDERMGFDPSYDEVRSGSMAGVAMITAP